MDELEHALTRMRSLQRALWGQDPCEMRPARRLGYMEQIEVVIEALRPMMVETRCHKGQRRACEVCAIYPSQACSAEATDA
jgi:hypothetical protein